MKSENLPNVEAEQYDPNLEAQDEDVLSGGNNRLTYILVGVIIALVLGYVALPKGHGTGLASVTPTFMLDDAAVTASVPAAAPAAKDAAASDDDAESEARATKKNSSAKVAALATASIAPATPEAIAAAQTNTAVPEAVAAPAPAAPEPAAAASTTLTGKIEDENGRPRVGATVLLKGSSKGTSTDANGNYSLEVPAGGENTLIYGYGGYDDEVMRTHGSQPVNVTLTPRAKASKRRH